MMEESLTKREKDVLPLLGEGFTNREISEFLAIDEKTVKAHVTALLRKLSQKTRTKLAVAYQKQKLGNDHGQKDASEGSEKGAPRIEQAPRAL